jgi:hypothetical protein
MTLKEREYTEILFHHLYIELKVDGKTEGTRRQGRRCKQLLDDFKGKRRDCKLKEEALDRTLWRTRFELAMDLQHWTIERSL